MEKEKLNIIYQMVCNDEVITEESLLDKGYTKEEIEFLFDDERLYETDNGNYFIKYTSDLFDFAKEMLNERKYIISDIAINKCYLFEPDNYEIVEFMFKTAIIKSVNTGDYSDSIKYLYEMREIADEYEIKEVNLYIYLLDYITKLPDDLMLFAKYMHLYDVTLNRNYSRYSDFDNRHEVIKNIYLHKFALSLKLSKQISDKNNDTLINGLIVEKLTKKAADMQINQAKLVCNLGNEDKIEEIIMFYEEEASRRRISLHEQQIVMLATKLNEIRRTGIIPEKVESSDKNFNDMIINNDFLSAFGRVSKPTNYGNITSSATINYILLSKIINEIDNIKSKKGGVVKQKKN